MFDLIKLKKDFRKIQKKRQIGVKTIKNTLLHPAINDNRQQAIHYVVTTLNTIFTLV